MNKKTFLPFLIGFVIILALIGLNLWLFPILFNTSYLNWYLKNGTLIGFITAIMSLAWGDINKQTALISRHPMDYLGACMQVAGLPLVVMGTHMGKNKVPGVSRSLIDVLLTIPLVLVLMLFVYAWLLVVVPLQYFVYLISGAPAREFSKSDRRVIASLKASKVYWKDIGAEEAVPEGWWDASLSSKPVAITNLFAALLLFGLRLLLG